MSRVRAWRTTRWTGMLGRDDVPLVLSQQQQHQMPAQRQRWSKSSSSKCRPCCRGVVYYKCDRSKSALSLQVWIASTGMVGHVHGRRWGRNGAQIIKRMPRRFWSRCCRQTLCAWCQRKRNLPRPRHTNVGGIYRDRGAAASIGMRGVYTCCCLQDLLPHVPSCGGRRR
ncbi:hypothetical protein JKP88DRAFT_219612 [Tribonema minus]|uniref:Uncharacterized protein n=1 Tax=Tribonema minus TaxID=303371 RepID=A0A835Z407_9STRA|nr:hypothetical protein JKP88DRAFT_219612 [Tribonema minus]